MIELLVVVSVMLILTAVAVPLMQPLLAGREVREAARMVNAYLAAAQSRAVEIGRPVGVWIERGIRDPNNPGGQVTSPGASLQLFIAEMPPPYAGDSVDARAILNGNTATFTISDSLQNLVQTGDFIKFNYQGRLYTINSPITLDGTGNPQCTFTPSPPYNSSVSVPYQIFRRPRKTSFAPLQLPTSTVIDIVNSGVGANTNFSGIAADTREIIITFNPNGRVDYVYSRFDPVTNGPGFFGPQRVLGSIHLLIGRLDQLGPGNLADQENRWVSISHVTGNVATSENGNGNDLNNDGSITMADYRFFALDKLGMGGR